MMYDEVKNLSLYVNNMKMKVNFDEVCDCRCLLTLNVRKRCHLFVSI